MYIAILAKEDQPPSGTQEGSVLVHVPAIVQRLLDDPTSLNSELQV